VLVELAVRAWPTLRVPVGAFTDHVCAHVKDEEGLATVRGADLYLAYACLTGNEAAWRELDRRYLSRVPEYVARLDPSPGFAEEVRQRLGSKLASNGAKLAQYTGRGPLHAWLRMAALREAHSLLRQRKHAPLPADVPLRAPQADPELALLKRRSASAFRKAFAEVIAGLPPDDRTLLRLHYFDGLTIDEVGRAFRVSRASAARLLAKARARIIKRMQQALREDLGENAPRAKSLFDLVSSQLDVSIVRHFRSDSSAPPRG